MSDYWMMTTRRASLVHKTDMPALLLLARELVNSLDRVSAIETENVSVQKEIDITGTLLHTRIKKVEKILTRLRQERDDT